MGDLTPLGSARDALNGMGINVGITTDINGNNRNTVNPNPGAFEFSVAPCMLPIAGGSAIATRQEVCLGLNVGLSLTGNSTGEGQTYQWQKSFDNVNWLDIAGANSRTFSDTVNTTTWFRNAASCNGSPIVYSTPVQVTTSPFVSGTFTINKNIPAGGVNQVLVSILNLLTPRWETLPP